MAVKIKPSMWYFQISNIPAAYGLGGRTQITYQTALEHIIYMIISVPLKMTEDTRNWNMQHSLSTLPKKQRKRKQGFIKVSIEIRHHKQ
jgi:hypothetical protein